jgi:hypothetical protein
MNLGLTRNIVSSDIAEQMRRTQGVLRLESKLDAAKKRRSQLLKSRENKLSLAGRRRTDVTNRALSRRMMDDAKQSEQSYLLRRQSEEHVMLRTVRNQ